MTPDDEMASDERRSLDRRVETLDHELRQLETQVAVMQATLNGLVSTVDSRHKAFERGQDLILEKIDQMGKTQLKLEADFKAPQDLSKLVFSPGVVLTIITALITIVGGQMASTWGMRSDIRDIDTKMSLKADADTALQKLQEERATTLKQAVDAIGRKQELQQIQFQELRDEVLGRPRAPR